MSWAVIVAYAALGFSVLVVWMLMLGAVAYPVGSLREPLRPDSSDVARLTKVGPVTTNEAT